MVNECSAVLNFALERELEPYRADTGKSGITRNPQCGPSVQTICSADNLITDSAGQ